jgi:hypothetical protein
MTASSLSWNLLPAGAKLIHIHVSCREVGGQHVTGFPCYAVEMTDEAQDAGSQTLLSLETTFSPLVFQLVGALCDLLRSVDMEFLVYNETPLEL